MMPDVLRYSPCTTINSMVHNQRYVKRYLAQCHHHRVDDDDGTANEIGKY